jgi:succinate dehydrogenase / fumarate reductase cytochrome b subunit
MAKYRTQAERPLSPHLQIYRLTMTMMMSIAHRISGAALYFGTVLLAWWLIAAASSEAYFTQVNVFFSSYIGRFLLLGYTWALIHHMLGGMRHLLWDTGSGFSRRSLEILAFGTLIGSMGLTVLIWFVAYWVRG